MKSVLVYIDEDALAYSVDLLEIARLMYGKRAFKAYALSAAGEHAEIQSLFDYVCIPRKESLANFEAARIAHCIELLHREYSFDAILIPATHCGRMIAPRAAMRLRAGLVADVTAVGTDGDEVLMVRPAFSGRMLATVGCREGGPVMMSVRPRAFSYQERTLKAGTLLEFNAPSLNGPGIRLIERRGKAESHDIRESEVLISGGDGAIRDFPQMERLAQLLHGRVAASRKAVDKGTAPRSIQVGQSGKIVSPRLYIALGISGSAQHVAGIRNAEYVISVNTDRHAPICSMSDIIVEATSGSFLNGLLQKIEGSNQEHPGG
jgi:electron transfer flavoprotein alpha subunit